MKKLAIISFFTSLMVFAKEKPKSDVSVEAYLFTPVALSAYEYWNFHPNHYEYQSSLLAFPGADGFGKYTTGGRGGTVIHVTNLNDSGPGSLRAAIDQTITRTIVFDVGGDINLVDCIRINENEGNLTILGSTAPSPGITLRAENIGGTNFGGALDVVGADNVIIRYITVRGENVNGAAIDAVRLEAGTTSVDGIILDHVSLSQGTDEVFGLETVENGTISNSLLLQPEGSGVSLTNNPIDKFSYFQNYISHSFYRNPLVGYGVGITNLEFINNIVFGFNTGGTDATYGSQVDVISNVYKQWGDKVSSPRIFHWAEHGYTGNLRTDGEFYIDGNIGANPSKMRDPLIDADDLADSSPTRVVTGSYIISWETTLSAIENAVLPKVGNSIYRDAEDTKAVADYYNEAAENTINPTNKTSGSHPVGYDDDNGGSGDSMPDEIEVILFGSETATNDPSAYTNTNYTDLDGNSVNGYTNIEKMGFYKEGLLIAGNATPEILQLRRSMNNKRRN